MNNKPKYYQIIDNPNLVRDIDSNAILSTNVDALNAYKKERAYRLKVKTMLNEFDDVKEELSQIKMLLEKVLDRM